MSWSGLTRLSGDMALEGGKRLMNFIYKAIIAPLLVVFLFVEWLAIARGEYVFIWVLGSSSSAR
ncbi:hypothetical protein ACTMPN_00095 [Lacticaseibacillus paracasei]